MLFLRPAADGQPTSLCCRLAAVSLTALHMQAVRDSGDTAPSVTVNIDTLTFDRVLIFLEAYALKRRPPRFAIHLLSDLKEVRAGSRCGRGHRKGEGSSGGVKG